MSQETRDSAVIWILIDHSSREAAFESVGEFLEDKGVEIQVVTITEVLGSVARDALTGGAERILRGLRVAFDGNHSDEDLLGAVRRARPDVLAVTNGRYLRALGLLENLTGIKTLQVGVLANYNLSTDWMNSGVGAYVVPHPEFRERLVANGAREERILVAGPPIRPGFAREVDREAARQDLGFSDDKVVVVRADSFLAKSLDKLVFQCSLVEGGVRFIFHHNGDQSTASTLRAAAGKYGLPAAMFGQVDDLERFVVAADAVLAPVHDPFISELAVSSRPMILVGADETFASQSEFLVEQGAARHVADVLRLGSELERALSDEELETMSGAASNVGSRGANRAVADAFDTVLEHVDEWTVSPATAPPGDDEPVTGGGEGDDAPNSSGPFETIGRGEPSREEPESDDATGAGGSETTSRAPARRYEGISKSEAKDQLAELILIERDIERELSEVSRQQERWRKRLDLAREWNEEDLAAEAEQVLRDYLAEAKPLERELADVRRQKEKLKAAARGEGAASSGEPAALIGADSDDEGRTRNEMEKRFRRLELDRDLDDLKDRIKRELGE